MEDFYLYIALITAGLSLGLGLVSFFTGLHKEGEKVDLVFGIMCILLFIYFMLPPVGFIKVDQAPYPPAIIFKRVFNTLYVILFPWFIVLYTGYKKTIIPFLIDALCVVAFITMVFSVKDSIAPIWVTIALFPVGLSILHGFIAVQHQLKSGEKNKASWLLFAMIIFAVFYLLTAAIQLANTYFEKIFQTRIFYPVNLFYLAFILIMGVRLRANAFKKFRLEKILRLRDIRWHSLLENMHLIIVELSMDGTVKYINPYAVTAFDFVSADELLGKNWIENFLPGDESSAAKAVFKEIILKKEIKPFFKNSIVGKGGKECIVSWTNVFTYDDNGKLTGLFSIGLDITEQEHAYRQIQRLKDELEKENLSLKKDQLPEWMRRDIIGDSQAISYAIEKAKQVAPTNASVLLEGETGVGKELFADLIQRMSLRNAMPYIKVNCAALPAELIEDELFGHEKGAFTGAILPRKGRFEMADTGTIFLDEIGELPLALQPKLLRVLQRGEFERVGGQQTIKVDVRIISATNRDLAREAKSGRFREDLFYRLNVFPVTIPSLRSRKEDIPLLLHYYIAVKTKKHNRTVENISKADISRLCNYSWPGNIRELKNVIERSVISSEGSTLKLDWFFHGIANETPDHGTTSSLEQVEKDHILKMLEECHWKINGENGAAEKLAMHPNTLRSKMKKLNITRDKGRASSAV